MAARKSERTVSLATAAQADLHNIWAWNADRHGVLHQRICRVSVLKASVSGNRVAPGQPVPGHSHLRWLLMRRSSSGHAHVAVFRLSEQRVLVARIYHSAQDWQASATDAEQ